MFDPLTGAARANETDPKDLESGRTLRYELSVPTGTIPVDPDLDATERTDLLGVASEVRNLGVESTWETGRETNEDLCEEGRSRDPSRNIDCL